MRSDLLKVETRYSDFKVDFDEHPLSGDVALSTNAAAVKRSFRNLMMTGPYERPFRPYIGAGLQKYLFENANPVTAQLIRDAIETAAQFEPRAKLVSVNVEVSPDENSYSATIKFGLVNSPEVVILSEIIRRVR